MSALWQPLRDELRLCRADGLDVPLWWRDDDAIRPTPALDRLTDMAARVGVPVHLAVIPALAEPALGAYLRGNDGLIALVHGWAHENHAPEGDKKAEFGHPRSDGAAEIAKAVARLERLCGPHLLRVFVPPWNRFDNSFIDALRSSGFRGLSAFVARQTPMAAPGLLRINTHVDPIDWRGTRGLIMPETIIAGAVDRLRARRTGTEDATEPLGLLTHHLVHTEDVWQFTETFLNEMLAGGAEPASIARLTEPDHEQT
ncbi:polysaccharide deacetylase family protein [Roseobacter ponti]|uniref:Polysaccharide deacetylase n=1 Tax=Roseobacter ponti TaxID=1891787 RepID=A0A858SV18_9RHOB|nr:polysaccharide deacetylase family protein [Roseobacter ponti]QJF52564.1 polysaccharide deacetylase [Roseobacter ponti]